MFKLRHYKKGEKHPSPYIWGQVDIHSSVRNEGLKVFSDLQTRNLSVKEIISLSKTASSVLYNDAWIITYEDEPEENEFGVVTP